MLSKEKSFFKKILNNKTINENLSIEKSLEFSMIKMENGESEMNYHGELGESDAVLCQNNLELLSDLSQAIVLSNTHEKTKSNMSN
jgi:hypothetical protein